MAAVQIQVQVKAVDLLCPTQLKSQAVGLTAESTRCTCVVFISLQHEWHLTGVLQLKLSSEGSWLHLHIASSQSPCPPVCLWHTFTVMADFTVRHQMLSVASSFSAALAANLLKNICPLVHVLTVVFPASQTAWKHDILQIPSCAPATVATL